MCPPACTKPRVKTPVSDRGVDRQSHINVFRLEQRCSFALKLILPGGRLLEAGVRPMEMALNKCAPLEVCSPHD